MITLRFCQNGCCDSQHANNNVRYNDSDLCLWLSRVAFLFLFSDNLVKIIITGMQFEIRYLYQLWLCVIGKMHKFWSKYLTQFRIWTVTISLQIKTRLKLFICATCQNLSLLYKQLIYKNLFLFSFILCLQQMMKTVKAITHLLYSVNHLFRGSIWERIDWDISVSVQLSPESKPHK